jgi:predicted DCC family thiol-disulfide oxidoreductase YuxK
MSAIEMFFDGACPLCSREVEFLRRRDKRHQIIFTDISAKDFDRASVGVPFADLMDRIHARLPDGTVIEGVEVFRRLYTLIGLGPLVWLSRLPGVSQILDAAYRRFAKNRLRLTGRCHDGECPVVHP